MHIQILLIQFLCLSGMEMNSEYFMPTLLDWRSGLHSFKLITENLVHYSVPTHQNDNSISIHLFVISLTMLYNVLLSFHVLNKGNDGPDITPLCTGRTRSYSPPCPCCRVQYVATHLTQYGSEVSEPFLQNKELL